MADTASIFDLLASVLAGEERSFTDVCRRNGLSPAQAMARMVDDGLAASSDQGAETGAKCASPMARYEQLQHAAHVALDAELTGARFRAVRTITDLADPEKIDRETSPARMRSLEMVRRTCISLMRLHLPTCNMAPPRSTHRVREPQSHASGQSTIKDSRPLFKDRAGATGINDLLARHEAQLRSNPKMRDLLYPASAAPQQEQLIPAVRFGAQERIVKPQQRPNSRRDQNEGFEDHARERAIREGSVARPNPQRLRALPRDVRRIAIQNLLQRGVPRNQIARTLRMIHEPDRAPQAVTIGSEPVQPSRPP